MVVEAKRSEQTYPEALQASAMSLESLDPHLNKSFDELDKEEGMVGEEWSEEEQERWGGPKMGKMVWATRRRKPQYCCQNRDRKRKEKELHAEEEQKLGQLPWFDGTAAGHTVHLPSHERLPVCDACGRGSFVAPPPMNRVRQSSTEVVEVPSNLTSTYLRRYVKNVVLTYMFVILVRMIFHLIVHLIVHLIARFAQSVAIVCKIIR